MTKEALSFEPKSHPLQYICKYSDKEQVVGERHEVNLKKRSQLRDERYREIKEYDPDYNNHYGRSLGKPYMVLLAGTIELLTRQALVELTSWLLNNSVTILATSTISTHLCTRRTKKRLRIAAVLTSSGDFGRLAIQIMELFPEYRE